MRQAGMLPRSVRGRRACGRRRSRGRRGSPPLIRGCVTASPDCAMDLVERADPPCATRSSNRIFPRSTAMARSKSAKRAKSQPRGANPFEVRKGEAATAGAVSEVHVFGNGVVCDTESRGHATPRGRTPFEIVVDASEGFIPLWAKDTTLRWRFRNSTMTYFANPTAAKAAIRRLFGDALLAWGDAAPVKFAERDDNWDFEIVMRRTNDCDANGCVLASAFFPDAGRHKLTLYPKM